MTATTVPTPSTSSSSSSSPSAGVVFGRLLAMEWTKFRSVRSTMYTLLVFVVLTLGLSALLTWLDVSQWDKIGPDGQEPIRRDPTGTILGGGFLMGQLAICVLGVMVITSEYTTGMIRASLLAAPKRTPMLAAKGLVFSVVTFVVGEIVAFGAFFIGAPILHSKVPVSLGDKGVLRALIGAGLYLTLLGLFALAIGAIIRHTAGAVTGVIGFVLVLAPLAQLLPGSLGKHVHAYLPTEAGKLIAQSAPGSDDLLSAWQGFGVFCLWTVALLLLAEWLLKRRDA